MGNCLKKNKISAQDHDEKNCDAPVESKVEKVKVVPIMAKLEAADMEEKMKKVRLMVKNGGTCKSGGVRIRMVMSQDELKKMLRCKDEAQKQSSMEQLLLHALKFRGRRISEVCDDERISSWKPSLDSIPEDSSFMNFK